MKKAIYFLGLISLTLINTLNAQSSFSYTGPNVSNYSTNKGLITSLWVNPSNQNHILAGSNTAGLWKTTDGGVNWACVYERHAPFRGRLIL